MQQRASALLGKQPQGKARDLDLSLALRAHPAAARHAAGLSGAVRHLRSRRSGERRPRRAARNQGGRRAAAARRLDQLHQPLEDAVDSARAGRRRCATSDKEHLASMAYRRYQKALKHAGAVDFDDLLLCTEELFEKFADVRARRSRALLAPAGRRVSGHQRQPVSDRQGAGRRAPQPVRRGRRRSVDLRLARGRGHAHSAFQARLARGQGRAAGGELPLDRRDPHAWPIG